MDGSLLSSAETRRDRPVVDSSISSAGAAAEAPAAEERCDHRRGLLPRIAPGVGGPGARRNESEPGRPELRDTDADASTISRAAGASAGGEGGGVEGGVEAAPVAAAARETETETETEGRGVAAAALLSREAAASRREASALSVVVERLSRSSSRRDSCSVGRCTSDASPACAWLL